MLQSLAGSSKVSRVTTTCFGCSLCHGYVPKLHTCLQPHKLQHAQSLAIFSEHLSAGPSPTDVPCAASVRTRRSRMICPILGSKASGEYARALSVPALLDPGGANANKAAVFLASFRLPSVLRKQRRLCQFQHPILAQIRLQVITILHLRPASMQLWPALPPPARRQTDCPWTRPGGVRDQSDASQPADRQ